MFRSTPSPAPRHQAAGPSRLAPICAPESRPWLLASAILASALGFIDGSVVAIAIPAIRADLGAGLTAASWIQSGYMLALASLILTGGALGDRFGLARVFGLGIALFTLASLVCAAAPGAASLVAARMVQGTGAALMVPGSLALIARAYPREERGRAIGRWAAASALTTAAGPLLGGLLLSLGPDAIWRAIFAINLPLGLIALWLLFAHVAADPARPEKGLDLAGVGLATAGLGLVAWALSGAEDGGSISPWLLAAGAALLLFFVLQERRSPHPMMPLSLFASRSFSAANLATFALYFALSAILFYLPMTLIAGWGLDEAATTLAFAPLSVMIFLVSSRAGALADRIGPAPLIAGGSAIVAAAFAGLALTTGLRAYWTVTLPLMVLMGVGMSLVVAPLSTAVMTSVEDAQSGAASGVNNAISRVAGLVAVALMGSVAAAVYAAAGGPAGFGAPSDLAGHAAASDAAFAAIAWITAGLALLAALVAALGIRAAPANNKGPGEEPGPLHGGR